MPRKETSDKENKRCVCKFGDKYFYGKTVAEAQKKREEYKIECGIGYDPDLAEVPFLDYSLTWLDVYRTTCNSKQHRMYETMI